MNMIFKSLRNSTAGIKHAWHEQRKVRLTLLALALGVPLAILIGDGPWQWVAMIGAILISLSVELINSCAEELCDHVTPERDRQIKAIKDMGSAAVFAVHLLGFLIWGMALLERIVDF